MMTKFFWSIKGLLIVGVVFIATEVGIGLLTEPGAVRVILMNVVGAAFIVYMFNYLIPDIKDGE